MKLYKEKQQEASSMESTMHTDPIFRKLNILKIKDMVDQGQESIMFVINKKEVPLGWSNK